MKKITVFVALSFMAFTLVAESKAFDVVQEASKKSSAEEALTYLESSANKMTVPSEKRAVIAFMAGMQEQLSQYDEAQNNYVKAAGIAAGSAEKMPKKSNEQLVLDAVRCALSSGNYTAAETYLNSPVRNSKDPKIQCYIKLYSTWSQLCRAENTDDLMEPVEMLKAYSRLDNMKDVHPAVFLTLWYITGEKSWSDEIKKRYPASPETAIVKGDTQLLPTPFWFFVPKLGRAEPENGSIIEEAKLPAQSLDVKSSGVIETAKSSSSSSGTEATSSGKNRLQLGLFSSEANAKGLVSELKKKGFDAYVEKEKKASGNVYYLVIVDEKDANTADSLRSVGYECYKI